MVALVGVISQISAPLVTVQIWGVGRAERGLVGRCWWVGGSGIHRGFSRCLEGGTVVAVEHHRLKPVETSVERVVLRFNLSSQGFVE